MQPEERSKLIKEASNNLKTMQHLVSKLNEDAERMWPGIQEEMFMNRLLLTLDHTWSN